MMHYGKLLALAGLVGIVSAEQVEVHTFTEEQ
mgnify:CR=1 FL=1